MRLICPNCGAQYEVEGSVIPDAGRDVQCSNCGHTWFQKQAQQETEIAEQLADAKVASPAIAPGDTPPSDAATPDAAAAPASDPDTHIPQRQPLDEEVASVLREEAELETSQRASAAAPPPETTARPAPPPETPTTVFTERSAQLHPTGGDGADSNRKDLLPDIEEINSTLAATSTTPPATDDGADAELRRRSGFRRGFVAAALVFAIMALVYVFAPDIADTVPGTATTLAEYVDWINSLRVSVDEVMQGAVSRLTALLAQISGDQAG